MNYPKYVEVDGYKFLLDTDYRIAIRCFEVIDDDSISDYERSLAVIYLLVGDIPQEVNLEKLLNVLKKYLSCGQVEEKTSKPLKKDMDLIQDEKYIVASFMSDYHLDLSTDQHIHWWHFCNLLNGLTGDCVLSKVREIRTCDLKNYKGKSKELMAKAKAELALKEKVTQEDEDALNKFDALFNVSEKNELDDGDDFLEGGE